MKIFFLFLFTLSSPLFGGESSSLESLQTGPVNLGDYHGVHGPFFRFDAYGRVYSWDEDLEKLYLSSLLSPELNRIQSFVSSELRAGIFCPDHIFLKHKEKIRYYYRLLALSYLHESLRLWESQKACPYKVEDILKSCSPKSLWMKDIIGFIRHSDIFHKTNLSVEKFMKLRGGKASSFCETDRKNFLEICSEKDSLYGLPEQVAPYWVLKDSHIMNLFSSEELGKGCLKRFSSFYRFKTKTYPGLSRLFDAAMESLPPRHPEGIVFSYGSLQQFGRLSSIFGSAKEKPKLAKGDHKNEILETRLVPTPLIIKKKKEIEEKIKKEKPKKEKVYSAFFDACLHREKFNLQEAPVDMEKFHYDLLLGGEKKEKAREAFSQFRERKIIDAMYKHESFGKNQAPVPLVFIKYLLDIKDHQTLFSLTQILGNSFYIQNDFDTGESRCRKELSRLSYDRRKREWLLSVLDKKKEKKKKKEGGLPEKKPIP